MGAKSVSPNNWPHRRWTSITEKQVPDEEDAADIIINLGAKNSSALLTQTKRLANRLTDCPAVGFRLSQSTASSIVRLDGDVDASLDNNEAYCRLQSLGIIVCKIPSSTDIL